MEKIVIVGGGVAGLSAGIYGQQKGFDVEVYEKHTITGGQCTGWVREGYVIDNCIHWLAGTKKGTALYDIWENIGVLGEQITVLHPEIFYSIELNGEKVTLWKDLDKTEKELLAISPADASEVYGAGRKSIYRQICR